VQAAELRGEYGDGESGWIDYDIINMYTMDTTKRNDVAVLARLGLSTFVNIGQMARYRYLYTLGKESQIDNHVQVNACELAQNRDKMIYHTCLAGLGIAGLLAIGIANLYSRD
jgi:hypothetical protein